jgi:hypothetical protein
MDLETIQQFKDLTIKYVTNMQNAYNDQLQESNQLT